MFSFPSKPAPYRSQLLLIVFLALSLAGCATETQQNLALRNASYTTQHWQQSEKSNTTTAAHRRHDEKLMKQFIRSKKPIPGAYHLPCID